MSGQIPLPSNRSRSHSWAHGIPTDSREQLEGIPIEMEPIDPDLVSHLGTSPNGSHPASSNPSLNSLPQGPRPHSPAAPSYYSLPNSTTNSVPQASGAATSQTRSGATVSHIGSSPAASVNSLWQLQDAGIVADSRIPLPESRASSVTTRRSSASSLFQLQNAGTTAELRVPLPQSRATSVTTRRSSYSVNTDSLFQLQNAGATAELQVLLPGSRATSVTASSIAVSQATPATSVNSLWQLENAGSAAELQVPLPESRATSVTTRRSSASRSVDSRSQLHTAESSSETESLAPEDTTRTDYWTKISPLLDCLPHLRAIQESNGRYRDKGSVRCIDYIRGYVRPDTYRKLKPGRNFIHSVQKLKHVMDPDVMTRMILVEDLSPEIINCIGSVFEVDPELFAEHLNRSGYAGMDYDSPLPTYWTSKAHVSLKWFRPVKQNPKVTELTSAPSALLNMMYPESLFKLTPGRIEWSDPVYGTDGRLREDASRHHAQISTNIFRRSYNLSARPSTRTTTRSGFGVQSSHSEQYTTSARVKDAPEVDWEPHAIPTAWEEKASFFRCSHGTVPIILLLLDPLPSISDFQTPLKPHKTKRGPRSMTPVEAIETKIEMSLPTHPRIPLRIPRNKYNATRHDTGTLKDATRYLLSTAEAINTQAKTVPGWEAFRADPILALLRVLQHDTKAFFNSLERALDEISEDSLDDYLMSRRLQDWRKFMNYFEIEVPTISKSLHDFAAFVFCDGKHANVPRKIQYIIDSVDADISRITSRLDEAYTALRADMQFSESRRNITEAKTVTKLTELAFLFVPLTFTASLFSMSIKELDKGVPAWTFVVTSLGMALLAYGVRLILTSEFLAQSSRGALERFWELRGVQRGTDAPLLTIALLTLREIWHNGGAKLLGNVSLVLFFGSLVVGPIALAWRLTDLDPGFNVAITLFLVLFGLVLAFGIFLVGVGGKFVTIWDHHRGHQSRRARTADSTYSAA